MDNVGWKFFLLYVVLNIVSALLVFFFFPETVGKTLEEIDEGKHAFLNPNLSLMFIYYNSLWRPEG